MHSSRVALVFTSLAAQHPRRNVRPPRIPTFRSRCSCCLAPNKTRVSCLRLVCPCLLPGSISIWIRGQARVSLRSWTVNSEGWLLFGIQRNPKRGPEERRGETARGKAAMKGRAARMGERMNGRRAPDHVTEDYRTVLLISIPPAPPRSTYILTYTNQGRLLAAPFNAATTGVFLFASLLFSPKQGRETLTPVQLDVLYANSSPPSAKGNAHC